MISKVKPNDFGLPFVGGGGAGGQGNSHGSAGGGAGGYRTSMPEAPGGPGTSAGVLQFPWQRAAYLSSCWSGWTWK